MPAFFSLQLPLNYSRKQCWWQVAVRQYWRLDRSLCDLTGRQTVASGDSVACDQQRKKAVWQTAARLSSCQTGSSSGILRSGGSRRRERSGGFAIRPHGCPCGFSGRPRASDAADPLNGLSLRAGHTRWVSSRYALSPHSTLRHLPLLAVSVNAIIAVCTASGRLGHTATT